MLALDTFLRYNISCKEHRAPVSCHMIASDRNNPHCQEADKMFDKTMTFTVNEDKEAELRKNLNIIYDALVQKGYNPINQIVGYILSEDPTYITTFNNARSLIRHIDRDELLQVLVRSYLQG